MQTLKTTIPANGNQKLTTNGKNYWVYALSGTGTEIEIKTNNNSETPHKAKTGMKFDSVFTELMLRNTTGSSVDITLLVGNNDEYTDYS